MQSECVIEAATIEDAVDAALEQLGVQQDAVEYEVLEEARHKHFGLGVDKLAKVRVWVKDEVIEALETVEQIDEEAEDEIPAAVASEPHDQPELTDEELDQVADAAADALRSILATFAIENPTIEEYEGDEGEIILDVMDGDLAILIGRHGRTLDALQTVVAAIVTKTLGFRYPVVVDIEGYRHRRRQKIEDIARRAADRASRQRIDVRLRPMTAYERRIVHVVLRGDKRVATSSEGIEPSRQVVIHPSR